jgi:hypothetical protein
MNIRFLSQNDNTACLTGIIPKIGFSVLGALSMFLASCKRKVFGSSDADRLGSAELPVQRGTF